MSRLLRVVPALLFVVLLAGLVVDASGSLTNPDSFFHLRLGEEFLHGWSLAHPGHVTQFDHASWVPTQWLSQIALAEMAAHWGLAGVAWLAGAFFVAIAVALVLVCRRQASPLVAVALTVLAIVPCLASLSPRPQVVSYLLIIVTVDAWIRTRDDGQIRWWLVPMLWVWAMLHGMWLLGIVTSLAAAVGLILEIRPRRRQALKLLSVPALMAAAGALTPVGPRLYGGVFEVGSRSTIFTEWQPANYTNPHNFVLAALLALALVLAMRQPRADWFMVAMLILSLAWAMYNNRTVPVAAVTLTPLLARLLTSAGANRPEVSRSEWMTVGGAVVACLAVLGFTAPHAARIYQPAWVSPALNALPPGTPVIADWAPAGYLLWRYPQLSPVMTGYADMYTTPEIRRYTKMMKLEPSWDRTVRAYGAKVALLDPHLPIAYALVHTAGWQVVKHSRNVELLLAPGQPDPAGTSGG